MMYTRPIRVRGKVDIMKNVIEKCGNEPCKGCLYEKYGEYCQCWRMAGALYDGKYRKVEVE